MISYELRIVHPRRGPGLVFGGSVRRCLVALVCWVLGVGHLGVGFAVEGVELRIGVWVWGMVGGGGWGVGYGVWSVEC